MKHDFLLFIKMQQFCFGICTTIPTHQDIQCLLYARFFKKVFFCSPDVYFCPFPSVSVNFCLYLVVFLSITVRWVSVSVCVFPCLSVFICFLLFLSLSVCFCPLLSVYLSFFAFLCLSVRFCSLMSFLFVLFCFCCFDNFFVLIQYLLYARF